MTMKKTVLSFIQIQFMLISKKLRKDTFTKNLRPLHNDWKSVIFASWVVFFSVNVPCMSSLLSIIACNGSFFNMLLLIRFLETTIVAHDLFCNLMLLYHEQTFSLCNIWITSFLPVRRWIVRPVMSCFPFLPGVSKFSQSNAIAHILAPKSEDKVLA